MGFLQVTLTKAVSYRCMHSNYEENATLSPTPLAVGRKKISHWSRSMTWITPRLAADAPAACDAGSLTTIWYAGPIIALSSLLFSWLQRSIQSLMNFSCSHVCLGAIQPREKKNGPWPANRLAASAREWRWSSLLYNSTLRRQR